MFQRGLNMDLGMAMGRSGDGSDFPCSVPAPLPHAPSPFGGQVSAPSPKSAGHWCSTGKSEKILKN